MMNLGNFAQMLLPFILLIQGVALIVSGVAEERRKKEQNKEKFENKTQENNRETLSYVHSLHEKKESWI